ncbi:microtubule-associated protein CRIPT-domain-containing protein [Bisporella sp. PMI_857]|nr:microtubule-associated protein CRIPT-domain-containing protein [Bisporella sp. PMI_857]
MVCTKCQKLSKGTTLATPGVKKKSEIYLGSPASSSSTTKSGDKTKTSATLGNNGIGKSKLLSKSARNPYASYSSSCTTCKTKIDQGRTYCQKCAYKANACAICGKANSKSTSNAPVVAGQKFTLK